MTCKHNFVSQLATRPEFWDPKTPIALGIKELQMEFLHLQIKKKEEEKNRLWEDLEKILWNISTTLVRLCFLPLVNANQTCE